MEMNRVREIFEVNLFAPMVMLQEFVHLLIASGNARIVQIGSINRIMPVPFSAAYNTSKAGLHSFCDTARVELAPFKIKVINVRIHSRRAAVAGSSQMLTGGVQSNISRNATLPDDSLYTLMEDLYQERRINASQSKIWLSAPCISDRATEGAIPTDTYAGLVVRECIKADPRAWVWAGKNSFLVWFMETFLPRTAFVS
uniref:Short-chain dehydrogenase/reductase family protein n=1 Tax=Mycena chlorophos TaxID=658473 RepID=A0ABQ0KW61_MYCCL|nr:short-chain dehydrogenase/reductase family protein [Mycena chlorophos]